MSVLLLNAAWAFSTWAWPSMWLYFTYATLWGVSTEALLLHLQVGLWRRRPPQSCPVWGTETSRDREPNINRYQTKPHKEGSVEPLQAQNQRNWRDDCQHWVIDSLTLFCHWCARYATVQGRDHNHLGRTKTPCPVPAGSNRHPTLPTDWSHRERWCSPAHL